jgi:protein-tyrosine phosphatase
MGGRGASEQQLALAFRFLAEQQEAGRNVLVHCQMGRSRSVSVLCGFLAWRRGKTMEAIWGELEQEDPEIRRDEELFTSIAEYVKGQAKWYRR